MKASRWSASIWNAREKILAGVVLAATLAIVCSSELAASDDNSQRWVATWITANAASDQPVKFSNQTIREVVHMTIGGSAVRLRLSNTFGPQRVRFDAVYVGLQKDGAALVPQSNHAVTFSGSRSIAIPEGAEALSDPVSFSVGSQQDLVISIFVAGDSGPATGHWLALETNYLSDAGNFAAEESANAFAKTTSSWYFLTAVEVQSSASAKGAVVTLGDSITDGASTRPDKNERWPDVLERRLLAGHDEIAVVNAGIAGNRVLTSSPCFGQNAMARLRRDVLAQTGIKTVILFEGINDIGQPDTPGGAGNPCLSHTQVTADEMIAGYQQIIVRTHAAGLKIFGATILPYRGFQTWNTSGEAKRVAVNQWIRTSGAFDGIIDFDSALRDPADPLRMAPQYDSGDHLHPGTAGHEAMGNAVDLTLFR
jgi:lysophospholipase L1-like esterase